VRARSSETRRANITRAPRATTSFRETRRVTCRTDSRQTTFFLRLVPSEPAAEVYARHARAHGLDPPPDILRRFRAFYATPWPSGARFAGDGRAFWRACVQASLAAPDGPALDAAADAVYSYFAAPAAWRLVPGATDALARLKAGGVRVGVASNFDARLPPLLSALGLAPHIDACVTSADLHGLEKPNPAFFEAALAALALPAEAVVVVGDDRRNDVTGGRAAGCHAWQLGVDVPSLDSVAARVLGEEVDY
jgi:putative hydrolase of the HAD superfamily